MITYGEFAMLGRMPSRRRVRRRGFTLMELLLVLAILVILGSLAGISIRQMQKNANVRATKAQITMFENAIKAYEVDVGKLPPSLDALREAPADLRNPDKWAGPYLEKAIPNDPWQNQYQYNADSENFTITSFGPNGTEGGSPNDDITSEN
jgi:general secretion pathway protein G